MIALVNAPVSRPIAQKSPPATAPAPAPQDGVTLSPAAVAAARDLPLQGTWNTRQIGGLPAKNGTIRENMVYRSDALQSLTSGDVNTLKAIPIKTVIDLREPSELKTDGPDVYQAPNRVSLPMGTNINGTSPDGYKSLVLGNDASLRGFFATMANPQNYPVLYHCHSGKDRTGIVSALLERVLGTPRDQIMSDYLLSQHDKPTKQVDASWMQAVFKTVDDAGGIDKFLQARGVTAAQLASIRKILIDPSVQKN